MVAVAIASLGAGAAHVDASTASRVGGRTWGNAQARVAFPWGEALVPETTALLGAERARDCSPSATR